MKHIKKKFLNEVSLTQDIVDFIQKNETNFVTDISNLKKVTKDKLPFFITDDKLMYQAFQINNRIIPEPDPILVYFHTAYISYIQLAGKKAELLARTENTLGSEPAINELYEYFGLVSTVVIFLFTTIETTMNRCIPVGYTYTKTSVNKTETHTKEQIERTFTFDRKLKDVLNEVTKKDFKHNFDMKYKHIVNLKNFRDDIIHTKSINQGETAPANNYKRAFDFDYEKAIHAVKDFCNFYLNKDLIVDCDCTKDW